MLGGCVVFFDGMEKVISKRERPHTRAGAKLPWRHPRPKSRTGGAGDTEGLERSAPLRARPVGAGERSGAWLERERDKLRC